MSESLTPECADADWRRYPDTVLRFPSVPGTERGENSIDLRAPVGANERALLKRVGLTTPFAVLTAHDPRGQDLSTATNAARRAVLEEELRANGTPFHPVDACSPDRQHCECSVAVAVTFDEALALARRYEQVAIFWFDGERFWIVAALVGAEPVPLPRTS